MVNQSIRKRAWAAGLVLLGTGCGSSQPPAETVASKPAAAASTPASSASAPPVIPAAPAPAPLAFPWPKDLSAPDVAFCTEAEKRLQDGFALLDQVWVAATCVLHRLPSSTPEIQAAFAEQVQAFRDAPSTAAATITIYAKDLPEPLASDHKKSGGDPNMKVDVFVADEKARTKLSGLLQPHLGMGSWRGICLPWQGKAGHSDVTRQALATLTSNGYQFSAEAIGVLTDAAQDPDFFAWLKMAAHAQTDSDAQGRPKDAAKAQDAFVTFVSDNLAKATQACKDGANGDQLALKKALYWTGYSVHALQDLAPHRGRTNPEHSYNASQGQNPDVDDDAIALAQDLTERYLTHALSKPLKPCAAQFANYKGGPVTPLFKVGTLKLSYDNSPQSLLEYKRSASLYEKIKGEEKTVSIRWFGKPKPPKKCSQDKACEDLLSKVLK